MPLIAIKAEDWERENKIEESLEILKTAIKLYNPVKCWALCSGGNDSLCSSHIAMKSGLCDGVVSINTTIGIQETRDHLTMVASYFGWPLRWLTPPKSYLWICEKFGMPGPGFHHVAYRRLKERCLDQLVRESKQNRRYRVLLITGCRKLESTRRMGTASAIQNKGVRIWVAPIVNWDETLKVSYQIDNGIARNPVTAKLGISGECLCGAFAKPGERKKICEHYPDAELQIKAAEEAARNNSKPAKWGVKPRKVKSGGFFNLDLCQQCERKNDAES